MPYSIQMSTLEARSPDDDRTAFRPRFMLPSFGSTRRVTQTYSLSRLRRLRERAVQARARCGGALTLVLASAVVAGLVSLVGCVEINGGAVEVSWAIFARDGRAINDCGCSEPRIAEVRLNLVSDPGGASQPCAGVAACRFSCGRKVGATPFMVPPGQYLMSLVPIGSDGNDLPAAGGPDVAVLAPPAQSRTVVRGQPTELEAYMLEASCASRCDMGFFNACSGG